MKASQSFLHTTISARELFVRKSLLAALIVVGAPQLALRSPPTAAAHNSRSSPKMGDTQLELHRSAAVLDVACEVTLPGCQLALVLRNASDGALGYKAMTNAPRRWSVRPNGGVIEAGRLGGFLEALQVRRCTLAAAR